MIPDFPRLHAITDETVARRADLDRVAAALATAGGRALAFHARGRTLTGREHYDLAVRLSARPPARLIVNDRLDVALALLARGVQLGAGSVAVADARRLRRAWWIGRSVHDAAGADSAKAEGADYLIVGPVFATPTHPDRSPGGAALIRRAAATGLPVIAIGGITPENAPDVFAAGAYGVAAIRALWSAPDPPAQVERFLTLWR